MGNRSTRHRCLNQEFVINFRSSLISLTYKRSAIAKDALLKDCAEIILEFNGTTKVMRSGEERQRRTNTAVWGAHGTTSIDGK